LIRFCGFKGLLELFDIIFNERFFLNKNDDKLKVSEKCKKKHFLKIYAHPCTIPIPIKQFSSHMFTEVQ